MLPLLQYAINDAYCDATRTTPFRAIYGEDPTPPSSWRIEKDVESRPCVQHSSTYSLPRDGEDAEDRLEESGLVEYQQRLAEHLHKTHSFIHQHQRALAERMKARVDASRRDPQLRKDDLVLVSAKIYPGREVNRKQAPKFYGPFILGDARGPNAFEVLGLPASMHKTINVSYLRKFELAPEKFINRPQHPCNLPVVTEDGEPEWEVEVIRDTRTTRRGRMFLVK